MTNQLTLPAFAKINLSLKVLGKRNDGYHDLCTVFQTVSLHDLLSFKKLESGEITLKCDRPGIPTDENNLIVKAARLLKERYGVAQGAAIRLEKRIPSPGGLGGGSSNGAVTLLGLCKLWGISPSFSELCEIAAQLGSDVPYFLFGGTALGTDRGTEIKLLPETSANFLLLITPNIDVSTASVFAGLNAPNLTKDARNHNLIVCHEFAEKLDLWQSELTNDLEETVFEIEPEIKRAKQRLLNIGASKAMMSGSGASVFGVFENEQARERAIGALAGEAKWRIFPVKTVTRNDYRDALGSCGNLLAKVR
jgi:4-diphosphocytidyl-2-C-methyl-D-erythritol kinase